MVGIGTANGRNTNWLIDPEGPAPVFAAKHLAPSSIPSWNIHLFKILRTSKGSVAFASCCTFVVVYSSVVVSENGSVPAGIHWEDVVYVERKVE